MNPLVTYAGVPADDTLGNRIEKCRAHAGIMRTKLQLAYSKAGITEASLRKIVAAKTVKELDSAIIKKLQPIFCRLAERALCHTNFIQLGYAAGKKFVPDWMPQPEE